MSIMYRDRFGNIVPASYVESLRRRELNRIAQNLPATIGDRPSSRDFVPVEASDAFDQRRFPIIEAFDAAHYPGACVQRYCVASNNIRAVASRYPLLGPRQATTTMTGSDEEASDDELNNMDLLLTGDYHRRRSDSKWVLVSEPITSSTTNENDDNKILPFERIRKRVLPNDSDNGDNN